MCDCSDENPCEFMESRTFRSRKPRKCCACRRTIAIGDRYLSITGKWKDSGFEAIPHCWHCKTALEILDSIPDPPCYSLTDTWSGLRECARDGEEFSRGILRMILRGCRKWTCKRGPRKGELYPVVTRDPAEAPSEIRA